MTFRAVFALAFLSLGNLVLPAFLPCSKYHCLEERVYSFTQLMLLLSLSPCLCIPQVITVPQQLASGGSEGKPCEMPPSSEPGAKEGSPKLGAFAVSTGAALSETDASSTTPEQRELEETSAMASSMQSSSEPWSKRGSFVWKQPSSDSELSAPMGGSLEAWEHRQQSHEEMGATHTKRRSSHFYSPSSPMSSDDESEIEDEDLKVELQRLREK